VTVTNHLRAADAPEGAQSGYKVYGFENVGFSLRVIAKEQMESGGEVRVQSGVISKVAQPEMSQMHHTSIQNSGADAKINQNAS
jgi:hypothetical protein